MQRTVAWLTVAVLAATVALPAGASARAPDAVVAAPCSKQVKRVKVFKRGMKAAKRRFFRTHRGAQARKRFVKQQRRKLAKLKRARKRCRARQSPVVLPVPLPPAPAPPGGSPPGVPEPLAVDAITDVFSDAARFAPGEVSEENGVEYVRTQLELELAPGVTVAAMNQLLARLGAEVVSSLAGVGLLTVRIPDPGSLAALRELVAGLGGDPALTHADLVSVPVTTELPSIISAGAPAAVRPQLASRAHAAWNARGSLAGITLPTLLLTDYFGDGPPTAEVAVQETAADFATGALVAHGYTMLGLAAGTFAPGASANSAVDQVTGMWAGPDLPLRVVDLQFSIATSTMHDRLLQLVRAVPGNVVVSTSLADGCALVTCTTEELHREARQWIIRVRGSGLEGRFLHVSSAGNIYPNLLTDTAAARGSAVNAAALMPLPGGTVNLHNTLVVENTVASDPSAGPVVPLCLASSSKEGGTISTVANDIVSFGAPGVPRSMVDGGTSSASPQVAGAAATLWALDPQLTPAEVAGRLTHTARALTTTSGDSRCKSTPAAPALDFYAAVLTADSAVRSPARGAILDVANDDGFFDEEDLEAFMNAFVAAAGAIDYSRFDLNGDGRTGGGTDRVDLDRVTPAEWSFSQRRDVLGLKVGHDENAVRDLDVLCHEAHGPLYSGDIAERDLFAREFCVPPVQLVVDPAFPATLGPGQSATLRIKAERSDVADASVSQQPGVRLEYTVTGGSISDADLTGITGPDGSFSTDATLVDPATQLEIEVVARAGAGGPELDRLTVIATKAAGPVLVGDGRAFLVANAEAADEVKESSDAIYSDSVSAADKDAVASASATTDLDQSAGGLSFTGTANISASDDGGGGDASAFVTRGFTTTTTVPYRLSLSAQGSNPEEVTATVSLGVAGATNPFASNNGVFGSKQFNGQLGPGDYELTAEVGCSPGNEGGTCTGSWSFTLDMGSFAGP